MRLLVGNSMSVHSRRYVLNVVLTILCLDFNPLTSTSADCKTTKKYPRTSIVRGKHDGARVTDAWSEVASSCLIYPVSICTNQCLPRYNIEPFFFSSSLSWIPSRFQEEVRPGLGDRMFSLRSAAALFSFSSRLDITITLTFLRAQDDINVPAKLTQFGTNFNTIISGQELHLTRRSTFNLHGLTLNFILPQARSELLTRRLPFIWLPVRNPSPSESPTYPYNLISF